MPYPAGFELFSPRKKNILLFLLSCLFQPYHYSTLSDIIDQPYRPVYHSEPCSNYWPLSVIKSKTTTCTYG